MAGSKSTVECATRSSHHVSLLMSLLCTSIFVVILLCSSVLARTHGTGMREYHLRGESIMLQKTPLDVQKNLEGNSLQLVQAAEAKNVYGGNELQLLLESNHERRELAASLVYNLDDYCTSANYRHDLNPHNKSCP